MPKDPILLGGHGTDGILLFFIKFGETEEGQGRWIIDAFPEKWL